MRKGLKAGRPALDASDSLRAQSCWLWVRARTGLTLEQWECQLYPDSVSRHGGKVERPRLWDRYAIGMTCPKDNGRPESTVGRVEAILPGFRAFYRHPLWNALGPRALSQEQAIAGLQELTSLKEFLFESMLVITEERTYGPYDPLIRRSFTKDIFVALLDIVDIDTAAAFLLMAHEAMALSNNEYRDKGLNGFRAHVPTLRRIPELEGLVDKMTDLVDERLMDFIYVGDNKKMPIRMSTKSWTDEQLLRGTPLSITP